MDGKSSVEWFFRSHEECQSMTLLYLQAAGLSKLVEYNKKKVEELHLQELSVSLADTISADPPLPVADAITLVQDRKKEWSLPDLEITKVCCARPASMPVPCT